MKAKPAILLLFLIALTSVSAAQQRPSTNLDGVLLNTDPVPVQSGEDAEIRFKIVNRGNTAAENVRVEIVDSFPFRLKPDRRRNYSLGKVNPGEEYYITSEVLIAEDAPDGQNSFKARIINGDFSRTVEIPVPVQSEDIELNLANLKTSPDSLKPDTEGNRITVSVVNNGEKTAENVVLNLDLPASFERTSSFSTRQALGNIKPGEVKQAGFSFDISRNASKGMKQIPATLSYTASDDSSKITQDVGFSTYVNGKPQFSIVSIQSDLSTGQRGRIKLRIRNTGSRKSESTRVRILDNSDLPFSFDSSSKFLGTLNPGSEGTVVFQTTVEADAAAKQYLMDFEVRGVKDSEVFVEEKVKSVDVRQGSRSNNLPLMIAIAVATAVLVLAAVFRGRIRSRLQN